MRETTFSGMASTSRRGLRGSLSPVASASRDPLANTSVARSRSILLILASKSSRTSHDQYVPTRLAEAGIPIKPLRCPLLLPTYPSWCCRARHRHDTVQRAVEDVAQVEKPGERSGAPRPRVGVAL